MCFTCGSWVRVWVCTYVHASICIHMRYIHISDTVRFSPSMYWIVHCVAVFWPSFLVCSLLPSMGPPPKGTLKHQSICQVRNNVGKLRETSQTPRAHRIFWFLIDNIGWLTYWFLVNNMDFLTNLHINFISLILTFLQ